MPKEDREKLNGLVLANKTWGKLIAACEFDKWLITKICDNLDIVTLFQGTRYEVAGMSQTVGHRLKSSMCNASFFNNIIVTEKYRKGPEYVFQRNYESKSQMFFVNLST
jgi:hypothetical protein